MLHFWLDLEHKWHSIQSKKIKLYHTYISNAITAYISIKVTCKFTITQKGYDGITLIEFIVAFPPLCGSNPKIKEAVNASQIKVSIKARKTNKSVINSYHNFDYHNFWFKSSIVIYRNIWLSVKSGCVHFLMKKWWKTRSRK